MDAYPGQREDGRGAGHRDQHVERAGVVCDVVWDHAAEHGGAVEDGDEVKREVGIHDAIVERVWLDVHEHVVQAEKPDELRRAEESVHGVFEGGDLDEGAPLLGLEPHAHERHGDHDQRQGYEPEHPRGPGESDLQLQLAEHDGVNDAADAAPRGSDSVGKGPFPFEVLGQDRDGGDKDAAAAQADAEALRQQEMPELGGYAGHHQAERDHQPAEEE